MNRLLDRAKRAIESDIHIPRFVIALAIVLVVAFDLRIQSVILTEVDTPVRADARQYFLYAYNLKTFGVYSTADTLSSNATTSPTPDAVRAPGYPLFIMPFLSNPPTLDNVKSVTKAQVLISTLTVLLVFLLARSILPVTFAIAAAALTAMSPHLVTMNVYLLTETLFCFLLVLAIFLIVRITQTPATARGQKQQHGGARYYLVPVLGGMSLAAAALTHPQLLYFLVPLVAYLCFLWYRKIEQRKILLLLLGFFLLFGPWIIRNQISLDTPGDSMLMRAAIRAGGYRDMMYQGNPKSYGYPYRFDSGYVESYKDFPNVVAALVNDFRDDPLAQMRWYAIGKPLTAWSWALTEGHGDVFVYPVYDTPYRFLPHFKATHFFMRNTHWITVALMFAGMIIVWLPNKLTGLTQNSVIAARIVSLLLLYNLAVVIGVLPLPRYTVPMRPFMYVTAMVPIAVAYWRFWPKKSNAKKKR